MSTSPRFPTFAFVTESNAIEGITGEPSTTEIEAHESLWREERILVVDLEEFVWVIARAPLRREAGMNVRVGDHTPPPGGPRIETGLKALLESVNRGTIAPYEAHIRYETLHPFMDGNGRAGRALWVWQMLRQGRDPFALGFLHRWYYESLDAGRAHGPSMTSFLAGR